MDENLGFVPGGEHRTRDLLRTELSGIEVDEHVLFVVPTPDVEHAAQLTEMPPDGHVATRAVRPLHPQLGRLSPSLRDDGPGLLRSFLASNRHTPQCHAKKDDPHSLPAILHVLGFNTPWLGVWFLTRERNCSI